MTLNDNPRTKAEARYKILRPRLDRLRRIRRSSYTPKEVDVNNHGWNYNQAVWDVHQARMKRLLSLVETELKQVVATLRSFGWSGYYF